jgi:hypothetical protein
LLRASNSRCRTVGKKGFGLGTKFFPLAGILRVLITLKVAPARIRRLVAKGSGMGIRILIVEDDRDHAESLADILEMRGHHVELADTGEQAFGRFCEADSTSP